MYRNAKIFLARSARSHYYVDYLKVGDLPVVCEAFIVSRHEYYTGWPSPPPPPQKKKKKKNTERHTSDNTGI